MSYSGDNNTLCERCSLLSFDDLGIGGQEVVGEDGIARLSFEGARIEWRPVYFEKDRDKYDKIPKYTLIRLGWYLDETIPDMPHLSRSSQHGCAFCSALRCSLAKSLAEEVGYDSMRKAPLTLIAYLSLGGEGVEGLLVEGTFTEDTHGVIRILFPIEAGPNCGTWLRAESAREGHYLTPENIRDMCRLLQHCTQSCHPWQASSFIPTRLIDVGVDSSCVPRLALSSDIRMNKEMKYAALSYCWGNEEDAETQIKTETASLECRYKSLPYEILTPAIKDAIALTRAIGLRYVWVDALCIVQDDTADWSRESSQMSLVYRHAFVTFCGLNSASCHETILRRAPAVKVPFQSTVRRDVSGYYLIRLQSRCGYGLDRTNFLWDKATSNWDKRGWTFQEQELSTRLLYFGGLKMHFRCDRCEWSEGDDEVTTSHSSFTKALDQIALDEKDENLAKNLYESWLLLAQEYSVRTVTYEKDRLTAISGLAHIVWEKLGDQYLAGIWEGDLLRGLDWVRKEVSTVHGFQNHLQNLQQRNYVAPSWSWAACTGGVSMCWSQGWRAESELTVLGVSVETKPQNPFGQVFGGFLQICGKVAAIPALLPFGRQARWGRTWWHMIDGEEQDTFIMAWLDWLQKEEEIGLENLVMVLLLQYHEVIKDADSRQKDQGGSVTPLEDTEAPRLAALMLHPAKTANQYYRVGVIQSCGQAGYDLMRTWFEGTRTETICII